MVICKVKAAPCASAKPPRGNAIDAWHAWCKSQMDNRTMALCGRNRCGLHNESSAFEQFHVRRDRMFHHPRRLRSTFASTLPAIALSAILAMPAFGAGPKTITAVMHSDLRITD